MSEGPVGARPATPRFPEVPPARDGADLDRFWTEWRAVIRNVARAKLRAARVPRALADADDAVQHAYLRLLERWYEPDFADVDPGRFVLGSVLRDFVRLQVAELRRRHNQPTSGRPEVAEPVTLEPGPEDLRLQHEIANCLRHALHQLPDRQRLAVELTVEGDLSREDIAQQIGVRAGTVSSHRTRGLRKLARVLAALATAISTIYLIARYELISVYVHTTLAMWVSWF
jgi:RNA polymerase sigma factor (sigma-70 family)